MRPDRINRTALLRALAAFMALGLTGATTMCSGTSHSSNRRPDDPPPPGPEDGDPASGWFVLERTSLVANADAPLVYVARVEGPAPRTIDPRDPDPADLVWLATAALDAHPEVFGAMGEDAEVVLTGVRPGSDAVSATLDTEPGSVLLIVGRVVPGTD